MKLTVVEDMDVKVIDTRVIPNTKEERRVRKRYISDIKRNYKRIMKNKGKIDIDKLGDILSSMSFAIKRNMEMKE